MTISLWLKKFWFIRRLNQEFSGKDWYGFTVGAQNKAFYIELFIGRQKLIFFTPKQGLSETNEVIVRLQKILDAWKNPRINGFKICHYLFKNKLTLADRRREKAIASFLLLSTPIIKRTP